MTLEQIAQIAHAAIRTHESLVGNNTIFGWPNMSSFQRQAILDCVNARLDNEMFYTSLLFNHTYGGYDPNFGWPTENKDKDETTIISVNSNEFKIRAAIFCGVVDSLKFWIHHKPTSKKYVETPVFNKTSE